MAGELLASGRAELGPARSSWGPDVYELRPIRAGACPVIIQFDHAEQVTLFLGRHETTHEIYDRDWGQLLSTLRSRLEAVVDGRYDERVRLSGAELGKARGVFHGPEGDVRISYSSLPTLFRRGPWQELKYVSYRT